MITTLTPQHPSYPALLAAIPSPPAVVYVRGRLVDDDALAVAIVGSRRATPYGVEVAERLASELASRGVTIVSGFARGIDTAAHRGALAAGGRTLAVLGCGVDVVYPAENAPLVAQVAARGALLSQFPLGTPPVPQNFPARNRTLAGLALGVIVVEAAERSGALITAGFAGDLGREVFAIPGRITSESSRGANGLLQDGAKLVQHWMDIVSELPDRWRRAILDTATAGDAPAPLAGSDDERMLRALSVDEPQHIERLMARVEMPAARASAVLTALELGGFVRQLAGQRWIAIGARARRV
ncbi:MAG TPA: DNA-processing protein DprA [Methylomirabilota bacterium]|jgi:DNA processing protein|nr:DNA-processing protein DprA [Methylomirabilota bacterium]